MNSLFQAGMEIQRFMMERSWSFCFIGGMAVIRWGEARMTQDVDLSLFSGFGNEKTYISLSALQFEKQMIKRASQFAFSPDCSLITCSAEDLIVLKAFADRMRDWTDIEGILMRQGKKLNTKYIIKQLTPLCKLKEEPGLIEKLNGFIADSL